MQLTATPHGLVPRGVSKRATSALDDAAAVAVDAGVAAVDDTDVKKLWRNLTKYEKKGKAAAGRMTDDAAKAWISKTLPEVMSKPPQYVGGGRITNALPDGVEAEVIGAAAWVTDDKRFVVYWRWEERWTTKRGFYRSKVLSATAARGSFDENQTPYAFEKLYHDKKKQP